MTVVTGGSNLTPVAPANLAWIEALRGVAAIGVVLYHASRHFDANYGMPSLKAAFQFGHAGVDLFFVISGFIILFVHFDDVGQPKRMYRYVARRLTRVLPIYWIALLLTITRRWAGGHGTSASDIAWAILPVPIYTEPVLGVAWTLQYELVFYVVFGVTILHRRAGLIVMAAWLGLVVISAFQEGWIGVPEAYWGTSNLEFFAGMAVAWRLLHGGLRQYMVVLSVGIVLFAVASVAEDLDWMDGYGWLARLSYGLPSALIVLGCAEASRRSGIRVPSMLRALGAASYSIYLFHLLLIGVMWKLWQAGHVDPAVPPALGFVLFVLGAIGAGIMISRFVEYKLLQWLRGVSVR